MIRSLLSLPGILILTFSALAQNTPVDFVYQLPVINTAVCTASNAEIRAYSDELMEFMGKVQLQLDLLASLKIKARSGGKFTAIPDNSDLVRELERTNKMLTAYDFSVEFNEALNNDAKTEKQQKMDDIIKRMSSTSDEKETGKLLEEVHSVMTDYCKNSSGRYIQLLIHQRSILKSEIVYIIKAEDIRQRMECRKYGYTYFPELSYEVAYIDILDHLKYIHLLLTFSPGNE